MNSGCICCSLVGDFGKALEQVVAEYHPDRILIEPSGVGKLSDVIAAVNKVVNDEVTLGYTVAVVDAGKVKVYMKNFGEFYNNQVETASTIILSRTDSIPQAKLDTAVAMLREHNEKATIVTTPWTQLTGSQLLEAMDGQATLAAELAKLEQEHHEHHHHHHEEHECCLSLGYGTTVSVMPGLLFTGCASTSLLKADSLVFCHYITTFSACQRKRLIFTIS